MIAWPIFFLAFLQLAALVSAVPPIFRREDFCVSVVTKTVTVTSTADIEPSPSSSNPQDDTLTIWITSTLTVTSTIRHDSSQASQIASATTLNKPSPSSNPSGVDGTPSAVTTQSGPGGVTVTVLSTIISISTETIIQTQTITETEVASGSVAATTTSVTAVPTTASSSSGTVIVLQTSSLPYYGNGTGYGNSSTTVAPSRTISLSSSVIPTFSSSIGASSPSSSPGSSAYSNSSSGYENAVYFTNWFVLPCPVQHRDKNELTFQKGEFTRAIINRNHCRSHKLPAYTMPSPTSTPMMAL